MGVDRKQRTIRNSFEVEGVGLHEGEKVRVFVRPGRPDSGVLFIRTDEPDSDPIPAHYRSVVDAHRRTTLGVADGPRVHTVEHLLAALHACGVDNVEVELDQAELPGLDGSAKPWFDQLQSAGIVDQKVPVKTFVIEQPVSVELDGAGERLGARDRGGDDFDERHEVRRVERVADDLLNLLGEGLLPLDKLISSRIRLDEVNAGLDTLASGAAVRQIIEFPEEAR